MTSPEREFLRLVAQHHPDQRARALAAAFAGTTNKDRSAVTKPEPDPAANGSRGRS